MKIRGLPTDMKVGCIDVRPKTRTILPLLPCGFCKFFHVEYFMCDLGHVTCRDCGSDELHKVQTERVESSCFGCGTRMLLRRVHISNAQLRDERLLCPCGFEGTLHEIQVHVREAKYILSCVLCDRTPEEIEMGHVKKKLYELADVRNLIEYAEEGLALMYDYELPKPLDSVVNMSSLEKCVLLCENKLMSIRDILEDVYVQNNELRPALEAIFRIDGWLVLKLKDLVSKNQTLFQTVISGITLEIFCEHNTFDGECWMGIFVRGCDFEGSEQFNRLENAFPLRARVIIRLHDRSGHDVAGGCFVTFADGQFTSASFEDPNAVDASYVGVYKFVLLDALKAKDVNGKLRFSFQFEPLYDV